MPTETSSLAARPATTIEGALEELREKFCRGDARLWPTAFALKELTAAEEARIGALVRKAVS